jgi:hypothetical protein
MIQYSIIQKVCLTAAILASLAGYNLWPYAWHGFFYQCNALMISLLFYLVKDFGKHDLYLHKVATIGFWFAISNLCDELFFDPTKLQWNEYVFALIIIVLTLKKSKGNARS